MDLNSIHLGELWLWANFIYWPILVIALYRAPWSTLLQKDSSNIVFATCALLFLLWHLKIQLADGLVIHLLGTTVLTLMFRWQVALLCNALIVLGITLTSMADFQSFAANGLLMGILPVFTSYIIWRINEWYLPANYFIYIFFAAFLSAGISILVTGSISYQVLTLAQGPLSSEMLQDYLFLYVPIMYPEAFLTGAIISIFVIYKPEWISTFDDNRYFNDK